MMKRTLVTQPKLMLASAIAMLALWGGCAVNQPMHTEPSRMGESVRQPGGEAPSCLHLWLEFVSEVQANETLSLTLKVKNVCDQPTEVFLGGRPAHDFVVSTADGKEVWRWLHGADIQMILQVRIINPNEVLTFTAEWSQRDNTGRPVAPGSYWVRGRLQGEPPQVLETKPERLTISP